MSDLRTYLNGLTPEQWEDAKREVALQDKKRAPQRDLNDYSHAEWFRHADELCRAADRAKSAPAAQESDQ